MTRDSDFKSRIRARMAETGENYTRARSRLLAQTPAAQQAETHPAAEAYHRPSPEPHSEASSEVRAAARFRDRTLRAFMREGRVTAIPMRRRQRVVVLLEIMQAFDPAESYREPEVNCILRAAVLDPVAADHATLRRELVDYGYLERRDGIYRVNRVAPVRYGSEAQETAHLEDAWFAALAATDR